MVSSLFYERLWLYILNDYWLQQTLKASLLNIHNSSEICMLNIYEIYIYDYVTRQSIVMYILWWILYSLHYNFPPSSNEKWVIPQGLLIFRFSQNENHLRENYRFCVSWPILCLTGRWMVSCLVSLRKHILMSIPFGLKYVTTNHQK